MIIYKTTNLINNKIYIGKDSKNNCDYLGSGLLLNKAILKYGKTYFSKSILELCESEEELNKKEMFWIEELNSTNKKIGYNIAKGGNGGDTLSNNPNIDKISLNLSKSLKGKPKFKSRGKKRSKQFCDNVSKRLKGKKLSNDHKIKISQNHADMKGENNPMYGVPSPMKGKKHLEKSKNKISMANSGEKNGMYRRSLYQVWLEKYGLIGANTRMQEYKDKLKKSKIKER